MSDDLFADASLKIRIRRRVLRLPLDEGKSINSLSTLLKILREDPTPETHIDLYRGHSNRSYLLRPSLFREGTPRRDEPNLLRELISAHPKEFAEDSTTFERLVRMQHYTMPTRLLDLSFNPLVGMYFACTSKKGVVGHLLRIRIPKTAVKYYDSDTVSGLANLAHLKPEERQYIRNCKADADIYKENAGKRLHHFISAEKPYFEKALKLSDLKGVVCVKPILNNRRILAQQGAFLLYGLQSEIRYKNYRFMNIERFRIFASHKQAIMDELDRVNVNESTMFPEIESAARYITRKTVPVTGLSEDED